MRHFIAEGQFVPRKLFVITAGTQVEAEQQFEAFLNAEHERKTGKAKRNRSYDLQRSSYTIFELPRGAGVTALALWQI